MIFFTSDTHFAHANIIEYCGRPFPDVEVMNRTMIERWNARVRPSDTVYHLGDFAFGPADNIGFFLSYLNGKKILIVGNHDRSVPRMRKFAFEAVADHWHIDMNDLQLLLTHKPVRESMEHPPFTFNLHGHVHGTYARRGKHINVGVDVRGFEPKTLEELLAWPH